MSDPLQRFFSGSRFHSLLGLNNSSSITKLHNIRENYTKLCKVTPNYSKQNKAKLQKTSQNQSLEIGPHF